MSKTQRFPADFQQTLKVPVVQSMVADLTTSTNCGATFGKAGRVIRSSGHPQALFDMESAGKMRVLHGFHVVLIWLVGETYGQIIG